jgi:two-component system, chemotaxis family, CheB/CheR fusion protein
MTTDNSNAEFRRQLRSLFAMLRAIVRRSAAGESSKSDYAANLEGRLGALARVQDMLMRAPDDGIDLEEMVHGELLAQAAPASRYRAIGPDTRIGREAAMPLALAFHELTLNALLHGVLTEPAGEIEVRWDHEDGDGLKRLRLVWTEHGAPDSRHPPTLKGFGLELIEKTLPYELDACTRVDWPGAGARVEILLPAQGRATFWRPGDKAHVA